MAATLLAASDACGADAQLDRNATLYAEIEAAIRAAAEDTSFAITEESSKRFAYGRETVAHLPSWKKHTMLPAAGAFSAMEDMVNLMSYQVGIGPEKVLSRKALDNSLKEMNPGSRGGTGREPLERH